jgi:hypothetical protein
MNDHVWFNIGKIIFFGTLIGGPALVVCLFVHAVIDIYRTKKKTMNHD